MGPMGIQLKPRRITTMAILEGNAPVESGGGSAGATPAVPPLSASPWQSESLLAESWSTMGDVDPEDAKSLDSSDGGAAAENLSSNSDMVHLEEAEEEEEEEDEELQTSVLDLQTAEPEEELLMSSEEPQAQFAQMLPPMALPPLPVFRLEPPSTTSTPTPSTTTTAAEEPPYTSPGLFPPSSILPPAAARDVSSEEGSKVGGPADLPVLLCGGAALVAVVGVMAYGIVAYCRK